MDTLPRSTKELPRYLHGKLDDLFLDEDIEIENMMRNREAHTRTKDVLKIGRITGKTHTILRVDVGLKSEGLIDLSEFANPKALTVGDEIEVWVKDYENQHGAAVLSHDLAMRARAWDTLLATHAKNEPVDGIVTKTNKKNEFYTVVIMGGIKASLPYTHANHNSTSLPIGHEDKFTITRIDNQSNFKFANIYLSYKHQGIEDLAGINADVGITVMGTIKNIPDGGALVHFQSPSDNRPLSGWLSLQDSTYIAKSAKTVFKEGEECEVCIISAHGKIFLTNTQELWKKRRPSLQVGDAIKVRVLSHQTEQNKKDLQDDGTYGRTSYITVVLPDEQGVLPQFTKEDLADETKVYKDVLRARIYEKDTCSIKHRAKDLFPAGRELTVAIKSIDDLHMSISLTLQNTELDPWLNCKYKPGSIINSHISRPIYNRNFFVLLPDMNVDGMLKLNAYQNWISLNTGDSVQATVIECDTVQQKILLAYGNQNPQKQYELIKSLARGSEVTVTILKVLDATTSSPGLYVLYKEHLHGFIRERKLGNDKKLADYREGGTLNAIVESIGFDFKKHAPEDRFVLLSVVALERRSDRKSRVSHRATLGDMIHQDQT